MTPPDEIYLWHSTPTGIAFKVRNDRIEAIRAGQTIGTKVYSDLMAMPMRDLVKLMLAFEAELLTVSQIGPGK